MGNEADDETIEGEGEQEEKEQSDRIRPRLMSISEPFVGELNLKSRLLLHYTTQEKRELNAVQRETLTFTINAVVNVFELLEKNFFTKFLGLEYRTNLSSGSELEHPLFDHDLFNCLARITEAKTKQRNNKSIDSALLNNLGEDISRDVRELMGYVQHKGCKIKEGDFDAYSTALTVFFYCYADGSEDYKIRALLLASTAVNMHIGTATVNKHIGLNVEGSLMATLKASKSIVCDRCRECSTKVSRALEMDATSGSLLQSFFYPRSNRPRQPHSTIAKQRPH